MALTTNLVAYWKFDESSGNAADSSGNSNTLTNNGTATYGAAKINNGVTLNGTSQYMYLASASQSGLASNTDLTLAFWINWSSFSGSSPYIVMGRMDFNSNSTRSYCIEMNITGSNKLDFETADGSGSNSRFGVAWTPSTGTWYHVAVSFVKSTGTATFYVNGAQQGSAQTGFLTTVGTGTAPFIVGAGQDSGPTIVDFVPATFDEAGVWTRALSSGEISQLYNGGSGLQYPFAGATSNHNLTTMGVGS